MPGQKSRVLRARVLSWLFGAHLLAGCALHETSPGHYTLGLRDPDSAAAEAEQAAPPPAAAPAPAAPAPTAAAEAAPVDAAWLAELPAPAAVAAAAGGKTPVDATPRRDAALEVIKFYISARYGRDVAIVGATEGVSPTAAQRFEEYHGAQTKPRTVFDPMLSAPARAYFVRSNFHLKVLSQLLPPASGLGGVAAEFRYPRDETSQQSLT